MNIELTVEYVFFVFVVLLVTSVLVKGLRSLATAIQTNHLASLLGEPGDNGPVKNSFSRVAGSIGAFGLAAIFIGVGYWALYTLFFGEANELENMKDLGIYFLSGSALFAPYAFNQLKSIFKG